MVGMITLIVGAAEGADVGEITVFITYVLILVVAELILDSDGDDDVRSLMKVPLCIAVSI